MDCAMSGHSALSGIDTCSGVSSGRRLNGRQNVIRIHPKIQYNKNCVKVHTYFKLGGK
jgi:hypothetical protein